jgi:hypothetical protein
MDSICIRCAVSKGVKDSRRSPALWACYPRNGLHPRIVETLGGWEADAVYQISAIGRVNSMIRGTLNG